MKPTQSLRNDLNDQNFLTEISYQFKKKRVQTGKN